MTSAPKKIQIFIVKFFFACYLTLYDLCMCDHSLGFEDCRLATHLLNSCVDCFILSCTSWMQSICKRKIHQTRLITKFEGLAITIGLELNIPVLNYSQITLSKTPEQGDLYLESGIG